MKIHAIMKFGLLLLFLSTTSGTPLSTAVLAEVFAETFPLPNKATNIHDPHEQILTVTEQQELGAVLRTQIPTMEVAVVLFPEFPHIQPAAFPADEDYGEFVLAVGGELATALHDAFGVGDVFTNNGILILLSKNERVLITTLTKTAPSY